MLVKAKDALPGRRYKTNKGFLIEIAVADSPDEYGAPQVKKSRDGLVLFHQVNETTGETRKSTLHSVGFADYELEDGLSEEESRALHFPKRSGRKKHYDRRWRGWAWKNKNAMESILDLAAERGCYVRETANYFSIGVDGITLCALYRNGNMGFPRVHDYLNKHYVFSHKNNDGFCESWLPLKSVGIQRFLEHLSYYITEERERLAKEGKRART